MTETNGSRPDSEAVKAAIAHHVSGFDRIVSERDELQRQNDKLEQMLTVMRIECEGLRAELAAERSRTASYQSERDEAVANTAVYQTLFISFQAQMRAFGIEHAPLVKETS